MEPAAGSTAIGDFGNIIRDAGGGHGREPVRRGPVTWYVEEGRKAKLRAVIRRRWLVSMLLLLTVVVASSMVAYLTPATYTAEAVLFVPAVNATTPSPGNPDAAAKLAKTLATVIPLNPTLLDQASTKAQVDRTYLANHLSATNDAGTGIIRLTYIGTDKTSTVMVLNTMALSLVGQKPPPPVSANSLRLITAPQSVTRSGGDIVQGLVLGSVLGLIVALAAAFALERTNPHVDGPTEVAEAVRVPVTAWNAPTTLGVTRLLRSWDTAGSGRSWQVALVPVGEVGRPRMLDVVSGVESLHRAAIESGRAEDDFRRNGTGLNGGGANGVRQNGYAPTLQPRITVVDLLGGDNVQQLETADTIVLVVAPGVSLSQLSSTARRLRNQGAAPAWSIFIPGRSVKPGKGKGSTPGVVRHGDL
jgi:capsular polysaccharide biosynthesis protein